MDLGRDSREKSEVYHVTPWASTPRTERVMSHVHPEQAKQPAEKRKAAPGRTGLRSMLPTDELLRRPSRPPDYAAENQAIVALAKERATCPAGILKRLAATALSLCRAHSAGLSLLEDGDQKSNFHWRAIAGQWVPYVNGGTPRNFGPCGTMVCSHPELDFPYWAPINRMLKKVLSLVSLA